LNDREDFIEGAVISQAPIVQVEEERISLIDLIENSSNNFQNPLDAMKEYLEERIGVQGLEAAYNLIKESKHAEYEEIY